MILSTLINNVAAKIASTMIISTLIHNVAIKVGQVLCRLTGLQKDPDCAHYCHLGGTLLLNVPTCCPPQCTHYTWDPVAQPFLTYGVLAASARLSTVADQVHWKQMLCKGVWRHYKFKPTLRNDLVGQTI
jgi:hypothetical protein